MIDQLQSGLGDRYRIERELGAGGMARVFLATDLKHHRRVAIKVLRPELAAAIGHERFLREIEIAAGLQHPHILPVYDSGNAGGMLFFVMPFVEGESLSHRIGRNGPLAPPEAVQIAREVAGALAYAHRSGIVHRDIKPANILLSQGHAVVADFGIARALTASATGDGLTQVGMAVGTPSYMSPEQALGEGKLDGRTDIYSLGVVLYEMLSGKTPFEGTTPQAILGQTLSGKVPRLASDPGRLQPVLDRAMARERDQRYESGEAFAMALSAPPPARRPARAVLFAAIVAAAVAAAGITLRGRGPSEDPRGSLIVFPFDNRTGDPNRDYLEEAAMNLLGLAASHWQDLRVFDDERTASLMRRHDVDPNLDVDFEQARTMAREARVGTLVLGDLRKDGDSLVIEAKVHDVATGDRLATHIARAAWTADPRPLFDRLASQILGTTGAPPGERPSVLAQTTNSVEAYRAYLAGTAALQRFQIDTAKTFLARATKLDSSFALAYLRLRDAEGWSQGAQVGSPGDRRGYVLAAERHSTNLPPRVRSLVTFHRAYEDGDFQRARRVARDLIARDSTDVEAWYQLGEAEFHHNSGSFPHSDSLGNVGRALHAFERTLALDSSYVLAYQHILDALASCANTNAWVCGKDSAIYAPSAELERRLGARQVEATRRAATARQIPTARGWVSAVPGAPRARTTLIRALTSQKRYDEAVEEARAMTRMGWGKEAAALHALAILNKGDVSGAVRALDSALATVSDTLGSLVAANDLSVPIGLVGAGGGLLDKAQQIARSTFSTLPGDSVNGPGNLRMSKAELLEAIVAFLAAETGVPAAGAGMNRFHRMVQQRFPVGSTRYTNYMSGVGPNFLSGFLASRDTTLLSLYLKAVDTTANISSRVMRAQLLLERGDTAGARGWIQRGYLQPHTAEFNFEQGFVRSFAWGDLLTRLGERKLALEAYGKLDEHDARANHPGLLVRSWAERGALYQHEGNVPDAIRWYEKFANTWENADHALQPMVDRARQAIKALKGELAPPR